MDNSQEQFLSQRIGALEQKVKSVQSYLFDFSKRDLMDVMERETTCTREYFGDEESETLSINFYQKDAIMNAQVEGWVSSSIREYRGSYDCPIYVNHEFTNVEFDSIDIYVDDEDVSNVFTEQQVKKLEAMVVGYIKGIFNL